MLFSIFAGKTRDVLSESLTVVVDELLSDAAVVKEEPPLYSEEAGAAVCDGEPGVPHHHHRSPSCLPLRITNVNPVSPAVRSVIPHLV